MVRDQSEVICMPMHVNVWGLGKDAVYVRAPVMARPRVGMAAFFAFVPLGRKRAAACRPVKLIDAQCCKYHEREGNVDKRAFW